MLPFNRVDLERLFPQTIWQKAEDLLIDGAVMDVTVESDGKSIKGKVRGQRRTPFMPRIKIANGRGGRVRLSSTCTCSIVSECEHAAATLLGLLDRSAVPDPEDSPVAIDPELEGWIAAVNQAARNGHADGAEAVLYLLEPALRSWRESGLAQPLLVRTVRAKLMRGGAYGSNDTAINISTLTAEAPPSFVALDDQVIGRLLGGAGSPSRRLSGLVDGESMDRLLATGRCHWRNAQGPALHAGPVREGRFSWRFDSEGQQYIVCEVEGGNDEVVIAALGEPWYLDLARAEMGRVHTKVSRAVAGHLVVAPYVPPAAATAVRQRLLPAGGSLPLPEPLKKRERVEIRPVPILHLHCPSLTVVRTVRWKREEEKVVCPLARVAFDYAGAEVGWQDGRPEVNHVKDNRLLVLPRDTLTEVQAIDRLNAFGLQPLGPTGLGRFASENERQDFTFEEDDEGDLSLRWVEFNYKDLPRLRAAGWKVSISDDYPFQVAEGAGGWSVEVIEGESDWFELSLGVEINGERVPLLPVLLDLFERAPEVMTPGALDDYGDDPVYGTLPDGRLLPIPAARLKAFLEALFEQFASRRLDPDGRIRLRAVEASRLHALEQDLGHDDLIWRGGEGLRALAARLDRADGLPIAPPPPGLKATLRPYQSQGFAWLQFLRAAGFSGILADDMGLGKTLQTLAHLLAEKADGRLKRPALIVAPTSLIPTWRAEARRFAPSLSILTLHGNNRDGLFQLIPKHDVVLTSYALLLRDQEHLQPRRFSIAILDEAQAIKNPGTKLAKAACDLKADQRLALSGTPIENHLGELWSVFHFLMPGFLGERETFRKVFRHQIEKEGDTERQALLARRVRPFLLRRTKEQVASELPPKSEFVREIELTDPQRDLYESVRLAMHARVRDEIEQRGLGRSNIAILEALLKLRQICCDPRLLKDRGAHEAGAKYDLLMEMIETMVETGRRIIVFSQFVEMLDLIEAGLTKRKIGYVILTGRTKDRETPVETFQAGGAPVFLVSLKAGGTGLTLTRADTVIHYDPWWNPAVEAQATDRAHRIGQDKTVFVYKLVASGTVEEKMLELQARKKSLVDGVLSGVGSGLSFSEEDIDAFFAPLPS